MKKIALVFIFFISINSFSQIPQNNSNRTISRKDTLNLIFPGFSSTKNDSTVTVFVKRYNDVIETKSFSKNGNQIEVNFYRKSDGQLLLAITKEINSKDEKSILSWTINFEDGKIIKMKSNQGNSDKADYNSNWNKDFIKKYILNLFAKIQAIS